MTDDEKEKYFWSFVVKPKPKRKKPCLRCGVPLVILSGDNRTCRLCQIANARQGAMAGPEYHKLSLKRQA